MRGDLVGGVTERGAQVAQPRLHVDRETGQTERGDGVTVGVEDRCRQRADPLVEVVLAVRDAPLAAPRRGCDAPPWAWWACPRRTAAAARRGCGRGARRRRTRAARSRTGMRGTAGSGRPARRARSTRRSGTCSTQMTLVATADVEVEGKADRLGESGHHRSRFGAQVELLARRAAEHDQLRPQAIAPRGRILPDGAEALQRDEDAEGRRAAHVERPGDVGGADLVAVGGELTEHGERPAHPLDVVLRHRITGPCGARRPRDRSPGCGRRRRRSRRARPRRPVRRGCRGCPSR